jgi:hypothetical protein
MSYNGSGTFQINTTGQPVVTGTVISSTAFNALTADLATGLSTAITKDGQTATTARIPFAAGINSSLATDSSSTSTGSIITAGGIGVAKAAYIGTTLNVASTTTLTGVATLTANPVLSAGTANGVTYLNGSKSLTSGSAITFDGTNFATTGTASASKLIPTGSSVTGNGLYLPAANALGLSTNGTNAVYIDSSQNVGIGTTSPSSYGLLTVLSSTAGSAKISIQDTSTGAAAPLLQFGLNSSTGFNSSDAARVWSTGVSATVASLNFSAYNGSAPTAAQMVLSAGRLIIGGSNINGRVQSQTPAAYTESNFRSDSATASGTTWNHFYGTSSTNTVANIIIYGNGNIQNANNSYGAISDIKLKENIVDATPKLASLMQVKIRNYNLKSDNGTNKQIGVIAQELESIFPSMVDTTIDRDIDNNEIGITKSVKYSVFVPMLIKAMQEQQSMIVDLTARITGLEAK